MKRYDRCKELLMHGIPVQFMSSGRSLEPLVCSGENIVLYPIITGITNIRAGDIVFCSVQPSDRYYVHLVWDVREAMEENGVERLCYTIGNNRAGDRKRVNGWCFKEHIYGILVRTERRR